MEKVKGIKLIQYFLQFCFLMIIFSICIKFKRNGVEGLVAFLEKYYLLSIIVIALLYTLKAFVLVLPVSIICIAVSIVFSLWEAILINLSGYILEVFAGYIFGSGFGSEMVEKYLYKKVYINNALNRIGRSKITSIMLIRFIPCFPNDVMSVFFGASKTNKKDYMIGSVVGFLPWLVAYSIAGSAVNNIENIRFILPSIVVCLGGSVGVFTYYKLANK